MSESSVFNKKTICVIVGASRGLGKTISIEFSKHFKNSIIILLSRNVKELHETKDMCDSNTNTVFVHALDLSTITSQETEDIFNDIFSKYDISSYEQTMIVHNSSTLGRIDCHADAREDVDAMQAYWRLNATMPLAVNNVFFRLTADVRASFILNISSLCAVKAFKSWCCYSAGKAMREMLFNTMCLENEKYHVMHYAPGVLNTAMQADARANTGDPDLKEMLTEMESSNKLVETSESVRKLILIMTENKFKSGDHLDYYDVDM